MSLDIWDSVEFTPKQNPFVRRDRPFSELIFQTIGFWNMQDIKTLDEIEHEIININKIL